MKKPLLDVIFASEKRKGVLMLLKDGPKETEDILKSLDTTRQALLPQMKILEEHYLVEHYEDTYELTTIGNIIVDEMLPLLDIIEVFNIDIDYWETSDLSFIPSNLINTISLLKRCTILTPKLSDSYNKNFQFHDTSKKSNCVYVMTEFLFPNYIELFNDLISNNVNIYFIISLSLYDQLQSHNNSELNQIIQHKRTNFYTYKGKLGFLAFGLNDHYLIMRLLRTDNESNTNFIWCKSSNALEWGKELFEYYLKDSTPITEL
jgi:predicted transcriptional regulator